MNVFGVGITDTGVGGEMVKKNIWTKFVQTRFIKKKEMQIEEHSIFYILLDTFQSFFWTC
jgi:hypothetical protein